MEYSQLRVFLILFEVRNCPQVYVQPFKFSNIKECVQWGFTAVSSERAYAVLLPSSYGEGEKSLDELYL